MQIGEVARQSGVSAKTVRYYESIGLMLEPPRSSSGYRAYGEADLSRLRFIVRAKKLGLTLGEIADVIGASDEQVSCPHVLALLETKRDRLREWIGSAQAMCEALDRTIASSRNQIATAPADSCPVIERGLHERAMGLARTEEEGPAAWRAPERAGVSALADPPKTKPRPK
ncbi:MAG: MerR family transcriptional regulator [Dehalococcoidia bacterium]